jgi:hypothetical protein
MRRYAVLLFSLEVILLLSGMEMLDDALAETCSLLRILNSDVEFCSS